MPAPLVHLIGHSPLPREMGPIIVIPIALFLFASAAYDRASLGRIHPVFPVGSDGDLHLGPVAQHRNWPERSMASVCTMAH
jgi:hypothetical protein